MRSGRSFFVLGFLMVAGLLVALVGCSHDKPTAAATENPRYLAVQAHMNSYVDSTLDMTANALQMVALASAGDSSTPINYGSANPDSVIDTGEWCLVYLGDVQTAFTSFYLDSIRFTKGGLTNSVPFGAETLNLRHTWRYESTDTTAEFENYTSTAELTMSGLKTSEATLQGTASHEADYRATQDGASVRGHVNFDATLTDLTFDKTTGGWDNGVPTSGQVTADVTIIYQIGTSTPDTTLWSFDLTFENGTMNATVVSDGATKTYSRTIN